jgi:hypothetical protein
VSTYKRFLAAGAAGLLGAGFATSILAQAQPAAEPAQPSPPLGASPTAIGQPSGSVRPPLATDAQSSFDRDRNISVLQHPREGYEARGIRTGTFLVFPKVTVTAERNDNIYASDTGEVSDTVWHLQPEIAFNSDWARHALQGYVRGTLNRYQDNSGENTDEYGAGLRARIDVLRKAKINTSLDASHLTEPRTSANSPTGATEPVEYDLVAFALGGDREFNRLRVSGKFDSRNYDYTSPPSASGGVIDQKFRNRTIYSLQGRADYAVSPATAVFAEITGNKHEYDRQPPVVPVTRDSDGLQALAGVNFEIGALTRGEVAVGYIQQTFDDPTMRKLDGLGARAQVEWFPTQLTTVTVNASRTVEDSAVGNSAGYLSSNIGAQVDHEFLRNFIVTGRVGYGKDKYTGITREDVRTSAGLSATYLINHNLGLTVAYDYSDQDTRKGVGADFTVNKVGATLTVQY